MDSQILSDDSLAVEPAAFDARAAEVYVWRVEELERAGYSNEYAHPLAEDHHIDLHVACSLLARGCPEHTAYLILS